MAAGALSAPMKAALSAANAFRKPEQFGALDVGDQPATLS
jgi:hypothetical protein